MIIFTFLSLSSFFISTVSAESAFSKESVLQTDTSFQALTKTNDVLIASLSPSLSMKNKYHFFLDHEDKKEEFKNRQENRLKAHLKKLTTIRKKNINLKKHLDHLEYNQWTKSSQLKSSAQPSKKERAFFDHERRREQYENTRKTAFLSYKKKYEKYQKRQKNILSARLKLLKNFRKHSEVINKQIPAF